MVENVRRRLIAAVTSLSGSRDIPKHWPRARSQMLGDIHGGLKRKKSLLMLTATVCLTAWLYALRAREHVEGDRHVFARHRGDCKHVKELVIPEDLRVRVGSAPCIDDGARGIEDPADGDK
jgi:hypothetical protein